eukprot:TRINITY_DN11587_c0_g1_i1.p1 TRINITY_DN11587_c0_g1~~TRINITY_DN11587_c0_g1_i1.p1  ORF type:complete len:197 (+),score=91.01 TRINITY_DN11587_c0_g1_i1:59-649(+)
MMRRAFVLAAALSAAQALTVTVEPRSEECFVEEMTALDVPMTVIFQVTAGGQKDVDVTITDPTGYVLQEWKGASHGRHQFDTTRKGAYKVCFGNKIARWTPKWVSFYINAGHAATSASVDQLDPIEKTVVALTRSLMDLQDEQHQMRAMESMHRETIELTNTRILYWSFFEAFILFVMGLSQMYYLKRFLEVKSSI